MNSIILSKIIALRFIYKFNQGFPSPFQKKKNILLATDISVRAQIVKHGIAPERNCKDTLSVYLVICLKRDEIPI